MFANLLRQPSCNLKTLSIGDNIDNDLATLFARAMAANKSLNELHIYVDEDDFVSSFWSILLLALCDNSAINSTFTSNHVLQTVVVGDRNDIVDIPEEVVSLLRMNSNDNKTEVARQKMLMTHFSGADASVEVFASMDTKIMPHAIDWIGRDDAGFCLMYRVARGMPSLFETSIAVKAGTKRKHT